MKEKNCFFKLFKCTMIQNIKMNIQIKQKHLWINIYRYIYLFIKISRNQADSYYYFFMPLELGLQRSSS